VSFAEESASLRALKAGGCCGGVLTTIIRLPVGGEMLSASNTGYESGNLFQEPGFE
jgi:hypothetical protein